MKLRSKIYVVSFSLEMYHEELHVPLPPTESFETMHASFGLVQCLWEHQLELWDQIYQLDQ
jgi:hypothetical protein